jgi:hypothetical protein
MYSKQFAALVVGMLAIQPESLTLQAQNSPAAAADAGKATVSFTTGGQMLMLGDAHIVSGIPTSGGAQAKGGGGHATPSVGQIVFDVPAIPDSIASRLSNSHKCGNGEACRFEASVDVLGPDGSPLNSYFVHGASVTALKLRDRAAGSTGRAGRLTIQYHELEAMPGVGVATAMPATTPKVPAAPAAVTSTGSTASTATAATSTGSLDTVPAQSKKHKFGKFIGGLVKEHGLQAVEMATPIGAAAMMAHSLNAASAAGGAASAAGGMGGPAPQSPLMGSVQAMMSAPGGHAALSPGMQAGMAASPIASAATAAILRKHLGSHGADSSHPKTATVPAADSTPAVSVKSGSKVPATTSTAGGALPAKQ